MTLPTSVEGVPGSRRARSVGIGRAHAKAILLGEHAVVYGAPALALPVPQLTVTASAGWSSRGGERGGLSSTMTGAPSRAVLAQVSDSLRRLTSAVERRLGVGERSHLNVVLDSTIPPGRGLGSSAATSRAVVLALADLFGRELGEDTAFELVQTAENLAHGRASGVDAMAVGASRPLLFQAGASRELAVGVDGLCILADSGTAGSTREAVELLHESFRRRAGAQEVFVHRAAQLTEAARRALTEGDAPELGSLLTHYHHLMSAADLSTERIDALVEAALRAGSLGAKITGGGLGGCVLALTQPQQAGEVIRRLHEAGAVQTWAIPLKGLDTDAY
ncbi:mevalonate kinase [Streptomyces fructofermentans]|uniref:mevalonate kinase n=1 Tax=Streptomyces fructofermentans TaxID=152141 RepID=UPI00379A3267